MGPVNTGPISVLRTYRDRRAMPGKDEAVHQTYADLKPKDIGCLPGGPRPVGRGQVGA